MRIRGKMFLLLVGILTIPLLIIYVFASSRFSELICTNQVGFLQIHTVNMALYFDECFDNLGSALQQFSSNEVVKRFVANNYDREEDLDDDRNSIAVEINHILKKNNEVSDVFIIDSTGLVLVSSVREDVGTVLPNAHEFVDFARNNNGISRVHTQTSNGTNYVYIVKRVYSSENTTIGYVCQKISLTSILSSFNEDKEEKYYDKIIVDSDGRALINDSITPVLLVNDVNFGKIAENCSDFLSCYNNGHSTSGVKRSDIDGMIAYAANIGSAGWGIICCYNSNEAKAFALEQFSPITTMIIAVGLLGLIGIIVVTFVYTSPVEKINNTISRLEHGDKDTRLEIKTKDDFGVLGNSINSVYDRYFDSEQRFKTVLNMMDNVVFEVYYRDYTVYVSDNFNQKFSFRAKNDTLQESFLYKIKVHKDDAKRFSEDVNTILISNSDRWEGEYRLKNNYGDFSWIRIKGKKYFDSRNNPTKIIGMLVDIDREKKKAINLMQKANYDELTKLYNRATFLRTIEEEIQLSYSRRSLDALMFVDLDDFKHFNDEYGHKCGDEVLKFVADTIKEITFDKGFGGRLGGDEFVMCLTNLKLIGDAGKLAGEVIATLNEGFISESTGLHFNIHCSIGIAFFRENGSNSTELLEAADAAMYRIKKSGKSNYAYASNDTLDSKE